MIVEMIFRSKFNFSASNLEEKTPVYYLYPGERYVKIEELLQNKKVQRLIKKMTELKHAH